MKTCAAIMASRIPPVNPPRSIRTEAEVVNNAVGLLDSTVMSHRRNVMIHLLYRRGIPTYVAIGPIELHLRKRYGRG